MPKRDFYEVLGVNRDATTEEIKKAYRRLARRYHPDFNPNDKQAEQKFKEVKEAYDVLSDPQKRESYNRFGHEGPMGAGFGGGQDGFGFDFSGLGMEDIFENFFGGGFARRRSPGPEQGRDLRYNLNITLEEAFRGGAREITVSRTETCSECEGSGSRPGTEPETCPTCRVAGNSNLLTIPFEKFIPRQTCSTCRGEGKIIRELLSYLPRARAVVRERKIEIQIPRGIATPG